MPIAISSQMNSSLVALTKTNDDVAQTQNRLATGLAVATAADNISIYFKAKTYADKAEALDTTNKGISQAVANLDVVDKALSNMKDNIKGARTLLNDALAKAVKTGTAVSISNTKTAGRIITAATGQSYVGSSGAVYKAGSTTPLSVKGAIVDPSVDLFAASGGTGAVAIPKGSHPTDPNYLQVGDIIQVKFNDSSQPAGSQEKTAYFKAADPALGAVNNTLNAGTPEKPYQFTDLESLANAMNSAFGRANANFSLKQESNNGVAGNFYLGMQLGSPMQSIAFCQVSEAGTAGSTFDFQSLFGNSVQVGADIVVDKSNTMQSGAYKPARDVLLTGTPDAVTVTYSSASADQTDQTAVDTRKQAADFFRQTLVGLQSSTTDAYLPGYASILTGGVMSVSLNDTGTAKQNVSIGGAIDFAMSGGGTATGLTAFNVTMRAGGINDFTDTNNPLTANFLDNAHLSAAIGALDFMNTTIGQFRSTLSASKVAMSSRLDFNKTVVTTLNSGATEMTAADSTQEAANLAALQNRQSFAVNNMTITKQAEQSLIQLLR